MLKYVWLMVLAGLCGCTPQPSAAELDAGSAHPAERDGAGREPAADAGATAPERDADAEEDAGPVEPVEQAALCDGSQEIRLTWSVNGGFVPQTWFFTNPYGSSFFAIDGECHYLATDIYLHGRYVTGTLTAEQAAQLSADLAFAKLRSWIAMFQTPTFSCADGSLAALHIRGGSIGCICGCPQEAPSGLSDALYRDAYSWLERMKADGRALTGPVSAIAFLNDASAKPITPRQSAAWPLPQSIASIPDLLVTGPSDPRLTAGPYALFKDAESASKLRALREADYERAPKNPEPSFFTTEADKSYTLYVRDEPSEMFQQMLEAFARAPLNP